MDRIAKLLARVPQKHKRQILEALDCLADVICRQNLQAEKLKGPNLYSRIRVGRYRIIFYINERNEAIVDDIRPRNEGTYRDY